MKLFKTGNILEANNNLIAHLNTMLQDLNGTIIFDGNFYKIDSTYFS